MSVRGKILWAASAVLLVFLYLASSTDLIIKEKVREIHTVSIVLDDVNDTYYQNFKKGVDQAARDYYADTSYITLYEEVSQEEQTKLVDRESGQILRLPNPKYPQDYLAALDKVLAQKREIGTFYAGRAPQET